jgi:two-component system, NarL family, sensor histidine kinase UhpB
LASKGQLDRLSEQLPKELQSLRHVRVLLMINGEFNMIAPSSSNGEQTPHSTPSWFAALIGPNMSGRLVRVVSASHVDPVITIDEPRDEIAEAWHNFASLAVIWLILEAGVCNSLRCLGTCVGST